MRRKYTVNAVPVISQDTGYTRLMPGMVGHTGTSSVIHSTRNRQVPIRVIIMGTKVSPHTFGKTGFTGASIVADPEKGASVVLLSNFTYPHREANADRIHAFRATLSDAFFG